MPIKFIPCKQLQPDTGKRVAIVGAGPAGLAAAGMLRCLGHAVEVYDRLPEPGGMLIFAIPEFRIPKKMVRESIRHLMEAGVVFHVNVEVGKHITVKELLEQYDAVIVATGTWKGRRLGIPGEDLPNVYNAMDWIFKYMKYKLGYSNESPQPLEGRVGIIGAGLTAVDICELAVLDFKAQPIILYRRSMSIAPARHMVKRLQKMGVRFVENVIPVSILGERRAEKIRLIKAKPTTSRKQPVEPIPGTEFDVEVDVVVPAIGLIATPPESLKSLGVEFWRNGTIKVNEYNMTNVKGLFAAGDVAHGPSNIGLAMKSGKKTAEYVDRYLRGEISWQ